MSGVDEAPFDEPPWERRARWFGPLVIAACGLLAYANSFRVPFVWIIAPLGVAACLFVMLGLPRQAWERFGIWLAIGAAIYVAYGYRHSKLRRISQV